MVPDLDDAGHTGLIAILWLIHDRYVLALIPIAVALLLAAQPRMNVRAIVAGLVLLAVMSAAGVSDHLNYNRALWSAVSALDRMGVPARDVDAGYMVNGWRQYAHPDQAPRGPDGEVNVPWVNGGADLPMPSAIQSLRDGSCWSSFHTASYGRRGAMYALRRSAGSTQLRRDEPARSR